MIQLLVLGVLVSSQSAIDLSSPTATVLTFVKSFESMDFANCAKCVQGGKLANFEPMLKSMPKGYKFKMDLRDLEAKEDGISATVTGNLWMKNSMPGQEESENTAFEKFTMVKVGRNWLIQPKQIKSHLDKVTPLCGMASMFAFGKPDQAMIANSAGANSTEPGTITISNLKQMAIGSMIYAADWDDKLPTADWQKQLGPYTKNRHLFVSPMSTKAKPSPYTFNPALFGKNLRSVKKPSETVLIYEGSKGIIAFLYNSRGAVAFVDGHVKLVTKIEAAKLLWKP